MEVIKLNLFGHKCPIPVQRTRKFLKTMSVNEILYLKCDDPETLHDIPILLKRLELDKPVIEKIDNGWLFIIKN